MIAPKHGFRNAALSMLAWACTASLAASGLYAQNLIDNGDFEKVEESTGFASRWGRHWSYTGESKSISDPSSSHGGLSYISVSQSGPNASEVFTTVGSARIAPAGSRNYKLSVWAKGAGQLAAMAYLYSANTFVEPDANAVKPNDFVDVASETWKKYTFDVAIPVNGVNATSKLNVNIDQFEVLFNVRKGPILLDDAELYLAENQPPADGDKARAVRVERTPLATFTAMPQPVIDGVVNAAEWARASGTTGFFVQGGIEQAPRQTQVHMGFDEKNLYIAFESRQDALMIREVPPGPNVQFASEHEGFEVWLQPPGKGYFQLIALPGGAMLTKTENPTAPTWGGNIRYAGKVADSGEMHGGILSLGKKSWVGEIAIPFSDLGIAAPVDGETWRVNFCRDYSVAAGTGRLPPDWTTWAPLKGVFADPPSFGYGQFSRKAPAFKLQNLGELKIGNLAVKASNQGPVDVQTAVTLAAMPDKEVLARRINRAESGDFALDEQIKSSAPGATQMNFLLTAIDPATGSVLAQSHTPFKLQPSFWIEPRLLYTQKKVEVAVNASRLTGLPAGLQLEMAIQSADGTNLIPPTKQPLAGDKLKLETSLDVQAVVAGAYMVKATLRGADGAELASTAEPLTIPAKPDWYDNQIGISDVVPTPFTPVTVEGNKVGVIQRQYTLQDSGLPQNVVSLGQDILAAPARIRAIIGGKPVQWSFEPLTKVSQKPGQVVWKVEGTSEHLDLAGTLTIDFDGFGLWDVKVTPKGSVEVQELSLDFDIKKEHALYAKGDGSAVASIAQDRFTTAPNREDIVVLGNKVTEWGSWSYSRRGWAWPKQFFNEIYIGSDERGFSMMTETKRNVFGDKYAEFVPQANADVVLMRINLISEPTTLAEAVPYKYFYQTTPVKPEPKDPKQWHITLDPGSVYNSNLDGYKNDKGLELLKSCAVGHAYYDLKPDGYPNWLHSTEESIQGLKNFQKLGIKIVHNLWYSAVADSLPEYKIFGTEWSAVPGYGWPSPNANLKSACLNSSYQQFMIRNTEQIINKMGFDGVYTDATAVPCSNPYHNCGYVGRDEKRHPDLNMLATRSFVKRQYSILKENGKDRVNFSHSGESTSSAAFVDVRTHGEELCQEEGAHYRRLSPDYFRAKYAQNEYGVVYNFHPIFHYSWRAVGKQVPMSEILMMCLVHRTQPTLAYNTEMLAVWKVIDPFWTESKYIAYWKPEAPATTNDQINILASTYLKKEKGEALVVVSNWSYDAVKATVSIDARKLGFKPSQVSLVNMSDASSKPIDLGNALDIAARDYKVLLIKR